MSNEKQVVLKDPEINLILEGDPEKQLEFGQKCCAALIKVVERKPKKVMINGEQYLEFEDWQTLGRFFGATVGIDWTKPVERDGKIFGYEARAIINLKGEVVSSAEAMCLRDEPNWRSRPEFMLRSMAQTRASAKAFRNVFAWVAILAGFKPTPAEEMEGVADRNNSDDNRNGDLITEPQMKKLFVMFKQLGRTKEQFEEKYGAIEKLTKRQASEIIEEVSKFTG